MAAVKAWPVPWAPYGCRGAWPFHWALCDRRVGVAGILDPVWPLRSVAGPLGTRTAAVMRGRSLGPRMIAVGVWPFP